MNSNDLSKLLGEIQKLDPTRYSEDTQAYQQWKADKILVPQKGAKKIAYESEEIFYGGGVGGGKTMLAIGMSLTKNYHTAIFRTTNNQFGGMQKEYERLLKHVPQPKKNLLKALKPATATFLLLVCIDPTPFTTSMGILMI